MKNAVSHQGQVFILADTLVLFCRYNNFQFYSAASSA